MNIESLLTTPATIPPPGEGEPAWDALPASRGVVIFEDAGATTSLVATTADIRALARKRLDPDATDRPRGGLDLRAVTRAVRTVPTGSAFESDLIYLELARTRLARVYRTVTDRWQGWFVTVDTRAEFPRFEKVSTGAIDEGARGSTLLGPLPDKHAAGRYVELLEDLFDLCRYHHILVQAPHGVACVYKEMGKCPAPCDGSETMDAYRARLGEAVGFALDPSTPIAAREREMEEAAGALDFERAERLRKWLERASEARGGKFRRVGALDALRLVAVAPSGNERFARLIAISGGAWAIVADVRRDAGCEDDVLRAVRRTLRELGGCGFSRAEMDRLGLICTWLGRSEKSRRGVQFVLADDDLERALGEAIGKATPSAGDADEASQEIENLSGQEARER